MNRPTPQEIEAARTKRGGWTRETLAEWGIPWPPPKGWRKRLEARTPDSKRTLRTLSGTCEYIDSGWTEDEWAIIEAAMRKRA